MSDLIERATKEMCLAGGCPDLNGPCLERGLNCWACVGREDEAVAAISVGLSALCQAFPDIRPLVQAFAREHGLELPARAPQEPASGHPAPVAPPAASEAGTATDGPSVPPCRTPGGHAL